MSLMPKQPCSRCKPLVESARRAGRISGLSEAVQAVSVLITEDPGGFIRGLPPDVRTALLREARKPTA